MMVLFQCHKDGLLIDRARFFFFKLSHASRCFNFANSNYALFTSWHRYHPIPFPWHLVSTHEFHLYCLPGLCIFDITGVPCCGCGKVIGRFVNKGHSFYLEISICYRMWQNGKIAAKNGGAGHWRIGKICFCSLRCGGKQLYKDSKSVSLSVHQTSRGNYLWIITWLCGFWREITSILP